MYREPLGLHKRVKQVEDDKGCLYWHDNFKHVSTNPVD